MNHRPAIRRIRLRISMRTLCIFLLSVVSAVGLLAADGMLQKLPRERYAKAGLEKLTSAELTELEQIIREAKSGELEAAERKAAAAEAKARAAEEKAASAEAKASASAPARKGPSWLSALITLEHTAKAPDASEEFRTKLKGTLETFTGRHRFELANGQIWQTVDGTGWSGPSYSEPEVVIKPGMMGAFWLSIPEAGLRLKVKPLKLE